jgi:hypothetical protein
MRFEGFEVAERKAGTSGVSGDSQAKYRIPPMFVAGAEEVNTGEQIQNVLRQ